MGIAKKVCFLRGSSPETEKEKKKQKGFFTKKSKNGGNNNKNKNGKPLLKTVLKWTGIIFGALIVLSTAKSMFLSKKTVTDDTNESKKFEKSVKKEAIPQKPPVEEERKTGEKPVEEFKPQKPSAKKIIEKKPPVEETKVEKAVKSFEKSFVTKIKCISKVSDEVLYKIQRNGKFIDCFLDPEWNSKGIKLQEGEEFLLDPAQIIELKDGKYLNLDGKYIPFKYFECKEVKIEKDN